MRQVLDIEVQVSVVAIALDVEHGGDRLAWCDDQDRLLSVGWRIGIEFQRDDGLGRFADFQGAEVADGLFDRLAEDHGVGHDRHLGPGVLFGSLGILGDIDDALGFEMSGFDDDRRGGREPIGQVVDGHFHRAVKSVDPIEFDGESLATSFGDRRIPSAERRLEGGPGLSDAELILEVLATKASHVGHLDQVVSRFGGGEDQLRVAAEFAVSIVIIGEVERKDGQAVVGQSAAGSMWFDDVDLGVECMRGGTGVEVAVPLSLDGVELHPRIGAAWHAVVLDHLATHIKELVESHFFPVVESCLVGSRIDRAKRDGRIADGSEQQPDQRTAVAIEYFDSRIGRRLVASGSSLDHPTLVLVTGKPKQVDIFGSVWRVVGGFSEDSCGDARCGQFAGFGRRVVRFGFGLFGQIVVCQILLGAGHAGLGQRDRPGVGLGGIGQREDCGRSVESSHQQACAVAGHGDGGGPIGLVGEVAILVKPVGRPGLDREVFAGTDQVFSVVGEDEVEQRCLVSEPGESNRVGALAPDGRAVVSGQFQQSLAVGRVPDNDRAVVGSGGQ